MKNPALNNAGLQIHFEVFSVRFLNSPSCLAVCFAWPQVALTHHVFQTRLYALTIKGVKQVECAGRLERKRPRLRPAKFLRPHDASETLALQSPLRSATALQIGP